MYYDAFKRDENDLRIKEHAVDVCKCLRACEIAFIHFSFFAKSLTG